MVASAYFHRDNPPSGRALKRLAAFVALLVLAPGAPAAGGESPDWEAVSKEAVDLLGRYIRIRSVNPPAETTEAAEFLAGLLRAEGIEVKTYEGAPGKINVLARLPATHAPSGGRKPRPILLLHHIDVVPVDHSRWPFDPFAAEIHDGYLYGRGAMDMKGLGVIHLLAFINLHRQRAPISRDVILLATADEETGGQDGARWMIQNHWRALDPEYVLDEGGFGSRDILAADGRLVFAVSVAEKKMLWLRAVGNGTAGHGSQPIDDNANDRLVRALSRIAARPSPARRPPIIEELIRRAGELAHNKFTRAIQRDTLSLTTLGSGVGAPPKVNVIPSVAEATIDCRLLPDTDVDRFLAELRSMTSGEEGVELEVIYRMDETPVTPHDTPLFSAIERAIRAEHPEATVAPFLIPYGTDSNTFRVQGAWAYGLTPMIVDAPIVASMHGDGEKVPIEELVRGVRIFYNMLRDFCGPA